MLPLLPLIPRVCRSQKGRAIIAAVSLLWLPGSVLAQPAPGASTAPLDPAAYASSLRELSERVRLARPDALAGVERSVPPVWKVDAGGQVVDVPGVWLQRRLRDGSQTPDRWPGMRAEILEMLSAAERDARELAAASSHDPATVRATLDEVLARPEFAQISRDTAMARLQARLVEWFVSWWTRLGGDRLPVRSTATLFAWIASLAALSVLAGWLIHRLRRSGRPGAGGVNATGGSGVSAEDWARRAAAAPDFREAARCAYRAVVRRFDEDGLWRADAARTPREYIRLLPRDHRRRPVVEDVARRFEEIWFGGRPATEDDRGAMLRRLRELGCLPAE